MSWERVGRELCIRLKNVATINCGHLPFGHSAVGLCTNCYTFMNEVVCVAKSYVYLFFVADGISSKMFVEDWRAIVMHCCASSPFAS